MKIGIIGSEATRGIFLFNSMDTKLYKTELISNQTTTISNTSPRAKTQIDMSAMSNWDKKIVENTLYKVWAERLKTFAPSVVILDFVPDVMYSSVSHDGTAITRNPIVLKNLKKGLSNQPPMHSDEELFFESWCQAVRQLISTIRETSPKALIVLHSAQLLNTYIDKEGIPKKVRSEDFPAKNALLKRINLEASTLVDTTISSDPLKFHGHELHPWGIGVAKYETKYNSHMLGLLSTKVLESKFAEGEVL